MRNYIYIISIGTIFFSCKQSKNSDIEVIKFDTKIIDSLKNASDTIYTKILKGSDWYSADYYINLKDSIENKIFKDSSGNIVALIEQKKGADIFAAEYYPNGQLMGKMQYKDGKVEGIATYYYSDGRIKETGELYNDKEIGIWKDYNTKGELHKTTIYDNDGNYIETK